MGIYQPPPPVFSGGAQPYQGRKLNPSIEAVAVNNPPFLYPGRTAQYAALVLLSQPPAPNAFEGGWQPLAPRQLNASLTAVAVNNPPFQQYGRWAGEQSIVLASQVPVPVWQKPYQIAAVFQSVAVVTQVPWTPRWLPGVLAAHQPGPGLPQLPRLLNASLTAVEVDNPPVLVRQVAWPFSVPGMPQLQGKLSPGIPGQSVDNPPQIARQIAWQAFQPVIVTQPGQAKLAQGAIVVASSQPYAASWLSGVLASFIQSGMPQLPRLLNPSITAVRVDNPPTIGANVPLSVLIGWLPPPPAPTLLLNRRQFQSGAPVANLPGPLLVSAGYNISDATSLVIKITRPDGSILTVAGTVGSKDAYTWNGLYEAGTYAVYQPVAGDINLLGSYQVDLTYKGPTLHPVLLHNNFFVTDLSTFATSPSSSPYGLVAVQNVVWF